MRYKLATLSLISILLGCASSSISDLESAANQGDMEAQYLVGYAYFRGEGARENKEKGINYYELASAQGHPRAQYQLGLSYMTGNGVIKDENRAGELFVSSAKSGHERASLDACVYYQMIRKTPNEAAVWCYVARQRNPVDDRQLIDMLLGKIEPSLSGSEKQQAKSRSVEILDSGT